MLLAIYMLIFIPYKFSRDNRPLATMSPTGSPTALPVYSLQHPIERGKPKAILAAITGLALEIEQNQRPDNGYECQQYPPSGAVHIMQATDRKGKGRQHHQQAIDANRFITTTKLMAQYIEQQTNGCVVQGKHPVFTTAGAARELNIVF